MRKSSKVGCTVDILLSTFFPLFLWNFQNMIMVYICMAWTRIFSVTRFFIFSQIFKIWQFFYKKNERQKNHKKSWIPRTKILVHAIGIAKISLHAKFQSFSMNTLGDIMSTVWKNVFFRRKFGFVLFMPRYPYKKCSNIEHTWWN